MQAQAQLEIRRRQARKADHLRDTIAGWKKDFLSFTKLLDVITKDGTRLPVQPSPILTAFEIARTGRDYVLKPRQVFMTTWELARDIYFFMTRPGARVVVLCQSDKDNSAPKEISARLVTMFEGLRRNCPEAPFAKVSDTRWVRTDGSGGVLSILGAGATEKSASKKGRSGTIHRLHVTEVAFFEHAYETLTAILECVPGPEMGTEITFESTPKGAAGFFYEGYLAAKDGAVAPGQAGKSGYAAHFYRWFEQPEYRSKLVDGEVIVPQSEREKELVETHKVSQEQLKWYRQKVADPSKGQAKVDQEYPSDEETCWLFDGRTFFDKDALFKLRSQCRPPIDVKLAGAFKVWARAEEGKQYVLSIDPSGGNGGDPAAALVLEKDTGRHVASLHGQFAPDVFAKHCALIGWAYNKALIVVERSSSHALVHYTLAQWERPNNDGKGYPNIYCDRDRQLGFKVTPASRPGILDAIEAAVRTGTFHTYDVEWVKEAQLFIVLDEKPQNAPGAHDDRIMALAIGWALLQVPTGLKHTEFAQSPSIAYANNPVAFEGVNEQLTIDQIVEREQRRWASATPQAGGAFGIYTVPTISNIEGF